MMLGCRSPFCCSHTGYRVKNASQNHQEASNLGNTATILSGNHPKNLAEPESHGKNRKNCFFGRIRQAGFESELRFPPKNPDHEILNLSCLLVHDCRYTIIAAS